MAVQDSGGTQHKASGTQASKNAMVGWLETQLTAAGWTVASGSGTGDLKVDTAAHPQTNQKARLRIRDSDLTNDVSFHLMTEDESLQTPETINPGIFPDGGLRTYTFIGNRYQFWLFESAPATSNYRSTMLFTMPWIPAEDDVPAGELRALLACDSINGTETTVRQSYRRTDHDTLCDGRKQFIAQGNAIYQTSNGEDAPIPVYQAPIANDTPAEANMRWQSGAYVPCEPLLTWNRFTQGQLWNCVYVMGRNTAIGTTMTYDGNAYECVGYDNSQNVSIMVQNA